jgi:hypothetical protein
LVNLLNIDLGPKKKKQFVWYNQEFVITQFVITQFVITQSHCLCL